MNKATNNMSNIKQPSGWLKLKHITTRLRALAVLAVLLGLGAGSVHAQYVFMRNDNSGTYYYANGTTWSNSTTFSPSYIWTVTNNVPSNNGRYLVISRGGNWNNYTYTPSLSTTSNDDYTLTYNDASIISGTLYYTWRYSATHYLPYGFGNLGRNTGADDRVIAFQVTTTEHNRVDNTVNPTITISSYNNNTITFNHNGLTGSYTNPYTQYTFNGADHNWYNNQDNGSNEPVVQLSSMNPVYTWSVVSGGGSFNGNVLTLPNNPNNNIVVRLTVSNISPLADKTIDFTLTYASVAQDVNTVTELTNPNITPSSAQLEYNENQVFSTQEVTATTTTTTIPAHITLTGGGTTYYYYNGALYTSTGGFSSQSVTHPAVSYEWILSGGGSSNLNLSTTSGITTTATHTPETAADATATLTVTASAGGVNKSATATITIYAPIAAPTITRTGDAIILATVSFNATIYYTIDGTTPSANNGTQYTGSFNLTTSPVTIKAIAIRGENSSTVTSETFQLTVATPVITINQSTGAVTISCATAGASIYYTTDGTDPSASSTPYASFSVSSGTTVKAIAIKTGYNNSDIASQLYATSGVSGGVVTLNDLEDHNWSYYSDATLPQMLRSLNPADVKITYNGNGTGTVSTTNGATPANNSWTANASTVKVSNASGENQSTFVYYKTLERIDGSTSDNPSGRCAYTIIPNPFSVRPTYQYANGDLNKYCGFYAWRITAINNGNIYTAATGGTQKTAYISGNLADANVLNADETYYFEPDGEYGMEVELEALWARAYVVTSNTTNGLSNSVSYERNFVYLSSNTQLNNAALSRPVTYTTLDPATGTGTKRTITIRNNFTCDADTKFENVTFAQYNNGNQTISAAGQNLVIGRGVTGTINVISGLSANATNTFRLRVESGTYNNLYFMGGYGVTTGHETAVMGCDYDRANGTNTNLRVQTDILMSNGGTAGTNATVGTERLHCTVKSGNYDLGSYGGNVQFYMSSPGQSNYAKRTLIIEGGNFSDVSGGMESNTVGDHLMFDLRVKGGTINGATYGAAQNAAGSGHRRFIITGGDFKGWIAGGANGTNTSGGALTGTTHIYFGGVAKCDSEGDNTTIGPGNATGGNIFGAGSGNASAGTNATVGQVESSTIVIADECEVEHCVYGGGNYGFVSDGNTHRSDIYILGGIVNEKVFGGSNNQRGQNVYITMTGGVVKGGVYGGSNANGTINYNVEMHINGGQVGTTSAIGNIHGGGYGQSTRVSGNVEITLGENGQTEDGVVVYGDVYGGSALGYVNGTSANNTYHTYVTMYKGTINGSLYGGGLGSNSVAANVYGPVAVKVYGGTINTTSASGSGGVYGANNVKGAPQRAVTVDIYGTDPAPDANSYALDAVYGGGNAADYTYAAPVVKVHNCDNSIAYVYGGGNAAAVSATDVTIYGGNVIGNVFGGGNGTVTAANVTGNTNLKIYGGTILNVFGGSNSQGTIGGTINVTVEAQADTDAEGSSDACPMNIGSVYGGGNMAASAVGNISIGCMNATDMIDTVYCGANQANITGNVNFTMTGGRIGNLFGGNNTSGSISGSIAVTVNWDGNCSNNYLGNVFGGGNQAAYTGTPTVTITNGTVSHSVYGGGNEAGVAGGNVTMNGGSVLEGIYGGCNTSGTVSGAIGVTINGGTVGDNANHAYGIFGGGKGSGTNTGDAVTVIIGNDANLTPTIYADVYGGSAEGNVNDAVGEITKVWLKKGIIYGDIYGGGYGDNGANALVNGSVQVVVDGGTVAAGLNSGGRVFGCNNANGTPKGTVTVTINGTNATSVDGNGTKTYALKGVYGGGNLAAYDPTTASDKCVQVIVNNCSTSIDTVFGGGNAAPVPQTDVTINGGDIRIVFAGGNGISGTPANVGYKNKLEPTTDNSYGAGTAKATIKGGTIVNVFGGSNAHGVIREGSSVNITDDGSCPLDLTSVYGGGNMANGGAGELTIDCTGDGLIDYVFGGANQADVEGNIVLNIVGGRIEHVFGGNNQSGTISGSITVNVEWDESKCTNNYLGYVYGGGNLATYSAPEGTPNYPVVNIKNGTVSHNVYGGGKGDPDDSSKGVITGNPVVTVGDNAVGHESYVAAVGGNVFGGGDAASVTGSTSVNVIHTSTVGGNVFGGGNAAAVSSNTFVLLNDRAKVYGNVYGGGNMGEVGGDTKVIVNGQN